MAQLCSSHGTLIHCVMHPVDLKMEFMMFRGMFMFFFFFLIAHWNFLSDCSVSCYHVTMVLDKRDVLVHSKGI